MGWEVVGKMKKHIIFSGTVQGVGFRYTSQMLARRWNLSGWVRNLRDGRVEMFVEGEEESIRLFLQDLERHFLGYIKDVQYLGDAESMPSQEGFHILPTV